MEFTEISGVYSKLLYKLLKQWKTTGRWEVKLDEFRRLLDIPATYRITNINQKVLNPGIKELQKVDDFKNLRVTKVKNGRKIETLIFTFKPWGKEDTNKKSTWKRKKLVAVPKMNYTLDSGEKADPEEIEKVMEKLKKVSDNDN